MRTAYDVIITPVISEQSMGVLYAFLGSDWEVEKVYKS